MRTINSALALLAGLVLHPGAAANEPDGSIPRADWIFLPPGGSQEFGRVIGDGEFGASSGDFDFFMIPARAGDTIEVTAGISQVPLDWGLYDKQGQLLSRAEFEPGQALPENFAFQVPVGDSYYLVFTHRATGLPPDPFDPGSGSGSQSAGEYRVQVSVTASADSRDDLVQEAIVEQPEADLGAGRAAATFVGLIPPDGSGVTPGLPMKVGLQAGEVLIADMWGVRNDSLDQASLELRDSGETPVASADDSEDLWGAFDPADPKTHDPFLLYEATSDGEFELDPGGSAPAGGPSGLFQLAAAVFEPGLSIDGGFSGAWFNPAGDGQGFDVEIVGSSGGQLVIAVAWFTTDLQGNAFWVQGAAPIDPAKGYVVVPVRAARTGSRFGPFFEPAELSDQPWGFLVFTFQDCDNGTVYYGSNFGFGTAEYPIQRITTLAQVECEV